MRLTMITLLLIVPLSMAGDAVPVAGSEVSFVPKVQQLAQGKDVNLNITGTALRSRFTFKVYALASYLQDGVTVKNAEELAKVDAVKLLHLVMERKVTGADFIDAFKTAVGESRAKTEFAAEFKKLNEALKGATADNGEYVLMLYVPNVGTRFRVQDRIDITIENKEFASAIWGTFLGPNAIDDDMKKGLVSQIGK
ncbi:hypothetical protein BH11PLA2_BH11PLA2_12560 [soil metagenome]